MLSVCLASLATPANRRAFAPRPREHPPMTAAVVNDDLLDDAIVQNPSPYYAMLRERHPCHWNERWRGWVLSRYDDVYAAMHSQKFLADRITPWYRTRLDEAERDRYRITYDAL